MNSQDINAHVHIFHSEATYYQGKKHVTYHVRRVPVERTFLEHKPKLLPPPAQEPFALLPFVQPTLTVALAQVFHRDLSAAHHIIFYHKQRHANEATSVLSSAVLTGFLT